jgi:hypothetical protein
VNAHLSEGFKRCLGPRALSLPKNKLLSHNINNFKKFYFSAHGRTATSLFVFLVHQTEAAPANGSGMEIEYQHQQNIQGPLGSGAWRFFLMATTWQPLHIPKRHVPTNAISRHLGYGTIHDITQIRAPTPAQRDPIPDDKQCINVNHKGGAGHFAG